MNVTPPDCNRIPEQRRGDPQPVDARGQVTDVTKIMLWSGCHISQSNIGTRGLSRDGKF